MNDSLSGGWGGVFIRTEAQGNHNLSEDHSNQAHANWTASYRLSTPPPPHIQQFDCPGEDGTTSCTLELDEICSRSKRKLSSFGVVNGAMLHR